MVAGGAASSSATCSTHTPVANFIEHSMAHNAALCRLCHRGPPERGRIGAVRGRVPLLVSDLACVRLPPLRILLRRVPVHGSYRLVWP